jgi:hypothetical protein
MKSQAVAPQYLAKVSHQMRPTPAGRLHKPSPDTAVRLTSSHPPILSRTTIKRVPLRTKSPLAGADHAGCRR